MQLFAVILLRGGRWRAGAALEQQEEWDQHARFMDNLTERGIVALGGPLEGTDDVLLIMRAGSEEEIVQALGGDPWHSMDLLRVKSIARWTLRLGKLPD
ncbi:MAG TPA: hypothetical protein VKG79_11650 [Bryobacteraceae bacterium]|nr:hypothetical protein [Bryobacteraceae bacterium]